MTKKTTQSEIENLEKEAKSLSFEDIQQFLSQAVEKLENNSNNLEESLKIFEQATHYSRLGHFKLTQAEEKIEMLIKGKKVPFK